MTVADAQRAPSDAQVIARALVDPAAFAAIFDRHHDARRDRRDRAALDELCHGFVAIGGV